MAVDPQPLVVAGQQKIEQLLHRSVADRLLGPGSSREELGETGGGAAPEGRAAENRSQNNRQKRCRSAGRDAGPPESCRSAGKLEKEAVVAAVFAREREGEQLGFFRMCERVLEVGGT